MVSVTNKRNGGSVLVFALLGLIALLAIGVVMISRASRDQQISSVEHAPVVSDQAEAVTSAPLETNNEATTFATDFAPTEVNFPPPPPPINTPDTRNLPPEG